jgi:hypothetical protein
MTFSELKAKLQEGMTTAVFGYGFDFQVDVVNQNVGNFQSFANEYTDTHDLSRGSVNDKFKNMKQKFHHNNGNLPWEIKNAASATQRQIAIARWLKAASGNNLQVVSNNSIVKIPKWQDVHIKS